MNERTNEINLAFNYKSETINAVLHTTFDLSNPYVTIIIPGIFGDRGDSRAMFTRIARNLSMNGFSVLRFDFLGGGSNFGNYSENDFDSFIIQLDEITSQFLNSFGFINKVIYVGFSEGLKFAFHAASKRNDIAAILSCNGLCVEESYLDKISRPKIKNGNMVYDSNLGTWINWSVVEKYKEYFIDKCNLDEQVDYFGIYSANDDTSKNSRDFWIQKKWPHEIISHADHLYTKHVWVQNLSDLLVQWHHKKINLISPKRQEFFLHTGENRICLKLVETGQSSTYILFLHGLFQNKSGPGFLFTQMANILHKEYNICMFDFPSSGDSDGKSEDLAYDSTQEILLFVANYLKKRAPNAKVIGVASGFSNYLLFANKEIFDHKIMLFPEKSNIWNYLSNSDKLVSVIDTSDLYDNYAWAEYECCILGNILNRSKGINLSTDFLKKLSEFEINQMLNECNGYAFVNKEEYCIGEKIKYVNDKQGLAMSAQTRDKLIEDVIAIINNITSEKEVSYD
ncbi:MAG: alpha/beta hydrolase [Oscillospiraceae bacterium]|jgi:pimeloyl-ACP methyl ester carboxylesterase|nr:alpha/beta hydrolase [Oscillospiraceae bacterium]